MWENILIICCACTFEDYLWPWIYFNKSNRKKSTCLVPILKSTNEIYGTFHLSISQSETPIHVQTTKSKNKFWSLTLPVVSDTKEGYYSVHFGYYMFYGVLYFLAFNYDIKLLPSSYMAFQKYHPPERQYFIIRNNA